MTRRLTRSRDHRWVAGVAGGIADYTGTDVAIVRVVLVVGTLMGAGTLVAAYLVAWVLVPRQDRHDTVWVQATDVPATASGPAPR